jgi:hypothetical protein
MFPRLVSTFAAAVLLSITGCSASDGAGASGDDGAEAVKAATPVTLDDILGSWGRSSMAEGPDGPVSITLTASDGKKAYDAKTRDGDIDVFRKGSFAFFATAKEAGAKVEFDAALTELPGGSYVQLNFAGDAGSGPSDRAPVEDGADLYRVTLSKDKHTLSFEPAARQRGQGLHAADRLGKKVSLAKDFNGG